MMKSFTENQAKILARHIWEKSDDWSKKLRALVLGDTIEQKSTSLITNEMNFDEACNKGVIRFGIEKIDDNCGLPCILIFPDYETESLGDFSIMIDCLYKYSVIEKYKVRNFEIASCLFHIINGVKISGIGTCSYSCISTTAISDNYSNTSLAFSTNRKYDDVIQDNPFKNYAIYNEQIAKQLQVEVYKMLPCLHVENKIQLSLDEMIDDKYLIFTDDIKLPYEKGRKSWMTCTWDFLFDGMILYIGIFNTEDKREVEILSDYIKNQLDSFDFTNDGKCITFFNIKSNIVLNDDTNAALISFQVDDRKENITENVVRSANDSEFEGENMSEELTMEEVADNLKKGKGSIKLVTKGIDGKEKEVAVWGGYELDGYDRTLNVFINASDLSYFAQNMVSILVEANEYDDPCRDEVGWQMTVDYLDTSMTSILRSEKDKIVAESYIRDEKKTYSELSPNDCDEIMLNANGSFRLEERNIEENLFILTLISLRKYLLMRGIVKELYEKFDESSGVLVKQTSTGEFVTTILSGKERPDLPCRVFLFGDQMCRPYIDEMLNLPTGMKVRNKDEKRVNKSTSDEEKNKYETAVKAFNQAKSIYDYIDVQKQFGSIQNYKDSATYIKKCKEKISTIDALEEPYVLLVNKEQKSKDAFEKAKEEYLATKEKYDAVVSEYERENGAYSTNIQKIDEAAYSEVFRIDKQIDKIDSEWDRLKERLSEAEDELDHTFALSLGKKRQLSEETELIRSKIQELDYERNNLIMERESIIKKCEDQKVQLNGKVQNLINEANSYISIINDLVEKANKTQKEVDDAKKKVEEFVRIHGADTISVLKEYLSEKLRREEQEKQRKIEEQKRKEAEKKKREEEDRKRKEQEKKEEDEEIERFILFRMNMIDRPLLLHEISGDAEIRGYRTKKGNRITNTKEHIDNLINQNKVMEARAGNNTYYGTT